MRYWVCQDAQIKGPYSREDLSLLPGISHETLVCGENFLGDEERHWLPLGRIPELASFPREERVVGVAPTSASYSPWSRFERFKLEAHAALEGFESFEEWLPDDPQFIPIWDPVTKDILDPAQAYDRERSRALELERQVTQLKEELEKYKKQQDEILERLNEKDRLLKEQRLKTAPVAPSAPVVEEAAPPLPPSMELLAGGETIPAGPPVAGGPPDAPIFPGSQAVFIPEETPLPSALKTPDSQEFVPPLFQAQPPIPEQQETAPPVLEPRPSAPEPSLEAKPMTQGEASPQAEGKEDDLIILHPPEEGEEAPQTALPDVTPQPRTMVFSAGGQAQEPLQPKQEAEDSLISLAPEPGAPPKEQAPIPLTTPVPKGTAGPSPDLGWGLEKLTPKPATAPQSLLGGFEDLTAPLRTPTPLPGRTTTQSRPLAYVPSETGTQEQPRRKQPLGFFIGLGCALVILVLVATFFLKDPKQMMMLLSMSPTSKPPVPTVGRVAKPALPPQVSPRPAAPVLPASTPAKGRDFVEDQGLVQALEFVKNYPLDRQRSTISQWLQYSFLSSGNEEEWSTVAYEANVYWVTYNVFKGGFRGRNEKPLITYVFEADLSRKSLIGKNPAAHALLQGGAITSQPRRQSSRPARGPGRRKAKAAVPVKPLPEEAEMDSSSSEPPPAFNNPGSDTIEMSP